ncbi:squalene synthase HpnC [Rhodopirellula halodulae]|uniref:squalene synthase HpnC n=1 Tax=Rhodopirellula halodulae TaxID=2894198 RepID=UPI002104DFE0|nr:squalene synthase HpnC [Rhodopirellula sp. JC737]
MGSDQACPGSASGEAAESRIILQSDGKDCFRDALEESRAKCRAIAKESRENFLVVTCLLPREYRQPFCDVYAFCRTADDRADESAGPQEAMAALNEYRQSVAKIYSGESPGDAGDGIFVALAETIRKHSIPRSCLDDLLDAFVQDQTVFGYDDEEALLDYCRRSANPVGRMILRMADSDDEENLLASDEICTALQLANFWQDVSRDRLIGRVYIPRTIMQQFGFDESLIRDGLAGGDSTPNYVRQSIQFLCQQTRERFHRGAVLIDRVPAWLSADLRLFVQGGLATLDAIEAIQYDVLRTRPVVHRRTQAKLLLGAMWQRLIRGRASSEVA